MLASGFDVQQPGDLLEHIDKEALNVLLAKLFDNFSELHLS